MFTSHDTTTWQLSRGVSILRKRRCQTTRPLTDVIWAWRRVLRWCSFDNVGRLVRQHPPDDSVLKSFEHRPRNLCHPIFTRHRCNKQVCSIWSALFGFRPTFRLLRSYILGRSLLYHQRLRKFYSTSGGRCLGPVDLSSRRLIRTLRYIGSATHRTDAVCVVGSASPANHLCSK